ncbi:MAG TPA: tetratricopeptide repeat-containing sensor histidine kinase [Bacteroidia bacterium]|nr:tetratricopeptide repeat-containing sensor histidine kinase [Bacteroidia bacterium]
MTFDNVFHGLSGGIGSFCKRCILLVLVVSAMAGPGLQAANVDSLRQVLAGLAPDSNGIKTAIQMTILLRGEGAEEAVEFGKRGVALAEQYKQPKWLGEALSILGSVYHFRSDYESALTAQVASAKQYRLAGDEMGIARADVNIAAVYLNRNNYEIAEKHLLEANEIVQRLNISQYKVTINTNLAIIYTERGEYDKAMQRHEASLAWLKENENLPKLAVTYSNIGFLYYTQDRLELALEFYDKAYQTGKQVGQMNYEVGFALQNKVSILVDMKRLREAEALMDSLWLVVEAAASTRLQAEAYRTESHLQNKLGNYKKAFLSLERYHSLQDSLLNEDQNARVAEMEKEYELQKRDAEIAHMEEEAALLKREQDLRQAKARTQWILIVAISIFSVLLLIALVVLVVLGLGRSKALRALRENHRLIDAQNREIDLQNQTLKVQNERLEDLNREKDGLVGIVAHDLKSPINKSLGLLELIQMQGPLNEAQAKSLEMIQRVSAAGNDLIRDLLDLDAVEHSDAVAQLETVDLQALWRELEATCMGEAQRKALELRWQLDPGCKQLHTDRKALLRVLDNLVSNAMKFSPREKAIDVRLVPDGGSHVLISIADQGPGISEEEQKKLFKKFQRLSARPTGGESSTGLGLAITQALVHKIGGEIWVRSALGTGTTFFVRLPVGSDAAVESRK